MSGETERASSIDVRAELESLLERDLLGPWDGAEEELPAGTSPAEKYLLGRLVPRPRDDGSPVLAAAEDEFIDQELVDEPVDAERDGEREASSTARGGAMTPSALGLSFVVPADIDTLRVEASWGRYERVPSQTQQTPTGRAATVWKRTPASGVVEIPISTEQSDAASPYADQEGVSVIWTVRHRHLGRGHARIVNVSLVNGLRPPAATPDTHRLYQAGLTVTALDGQQAVFAGHNDPQLRAPAGTSDGERAHLELLHRRARSYATGRRCAVDADVRPGENRAWRLRTTCFPAAEVAPVLPGDPAAMPGVELDMNRLGHPELASDDLIAGLLPLVAGYRAWLAVQAERVEQGADEQVADYASVARQALTRGMTIADRLERAVELLRTDGQAREAFRFVNQAMARQRVRGELVRRRIADPSAKERDLLRELDVPANRSWRPFQLAFVLLCLPGLTDPTHPDAHRGPEDGEVQLLFFPTGGGKTEAYLGLTAYTLAIRRLQGVVGDGPDARDGSDGVAVLMRYTLRLLTAQQFQRAAALICACEILRRERLAGGDRRWGTTPFRLGLWVGASVTPNKYEDAKRQVLDAVQDGKGVGGPLQLVACPWCGSQLEGGRDVRTDDARRRILLYCSDEDGRCAFTEARAQGEGLPVLTVDEEIYRLTPALVISTVDKLAQLPWRAGTAPLFGLVERRCPRHGWQTPDTEEYCRTRHPATARLPPAEPSTSLRLRPPDLIIQDELHLIGDALGSIVGLFETVVDQLASRPTREGVARPVLVASTATVRRAADQVKQVFARELSVFPPEVIDAGETFFSRRAMPTEGLPGRRYRGICTPGERMKAVTIRVYSTLLEHAQFLLDRYGDAADPYLTLVGYFSSVRDLAGTRRLVDDDIAERLSSQAIRTRRRRPEIKELTSRMPSSQIAATLGELERPFDPAFDATSALDSWRTMTAAEREAQPFRARPIDVLLATSMLQVGVDVPRLGLMVVNGQPKNTAEYIQATSRVGRTVAKPGLIVTVFQWNRPRDLAHYEAFAHGHETFGRRVEGVTTTPYSDRALDRGLTAVLVAAARHGSANALPNRAAHTVSLTGAEADALVALLGRRAELVTSDTRWADEVRQQVRNRLDSWLAKRSRLPSGVLGYRAEAGVTGLLREPDEGAWDLWSAPMSLREVEPEILLQLDHRDPSLDAAPNWQYDVAAGATGGSS